MVRKPSPTRYLVLQVRIATFLILCSSIYYVTGQPILTIGLANCGDDVKLTCSQSGFSSSAGRFWKKGNVTISDTGRDNSGTDRYSEKYTSNDFSLVISNAELADVDSYKCVYQFNQSNAESLSFECKPTECGVDVTRNNQNKLSIQIKNIYPRTITVAVTCALQGNSPKAIKGTPGIPTPNGDHFDIKWMSDDTISAGTYDCSVTVDTRTSTEIVKTGLTFSDPSSLDDETVKINGLSVGFGCLGFVNLFALILYCMHRKGKCKCGSKIETKNGSETDQRLPGAVTTCNEETETGTGVRVGWDQGQQQKAVQPKKSVERTTTTRANAEISSPDQKLNSNLPVLTESEESKGTANTVVSRTDQQLDLNVLDDAQAQAGSVESKETANTVVSRPGQQLDSNVLDDAQAQTGSVESKETANTVVSRTDQQLDLNVLDDAQAQTGSVESKETANTVVSRTDQQLILNVLDDAQAQTGSVGSMVTATTEVSSTEQQLNKNGPDNPQAQTGYS